MKHTIIHLKSLCLFFMLWVTSVGTFAQTITITGSVKDESGEGLIGVSVLQKGTTNGTVTDLNGNYSIAVNQQNTVLVYSYIGYITCLLYTSPSPRD